MKHKLFLVAFTFLLTIIPLKAYSNVSMPGYWNVGTARNLSPISKNADISIQMKSELIKVAIYRGFAVVKGEYIMYNHSSKNINLELGYPENGLFLNKEVQNVIFNDLDNLKVFINDAEIKTNKIKNDSSTNNKVRSWYVWKNNFLAKKETKIVVYYLLDTHYAKIKKGYSSGDGDAFAYIIESGKVWKNNIEKGLVYISLQDNLTEKDIIGFLPFDRLKYSNSDNAIIYSFTDLKPDKENNIIIRYQASPDSFNFDKIKRESQDYYNFLDQIIPNQNMSDYKIMEKKDFSVADYSTYFLLAFLAILIFLTIFLINILRLLIRLFKRNIKKQN